MLVLPESLLLEVVLSMGVAVHVGVLAVVVDNWSKDKAVVGMKADKKEKMIERRMEDQEDKNDKAEGCNKEECKGRLCNLLALVHLG